jgi:hypothetical protein
MLVDRKFDGRNQSHRCRRCSATTPARVTPKLPIRRDRQLLARDLDVDFRHGIGRSARLVRSSFPSVFCWHIFDGQHVAASPGMAAASNGDLSGSGGLGYSVAKLAIWWWRTQTRFPQESNEIESRFPLHQELIYLAGITGAGIGAMARPSNRSRLAAIKSSRNIATARTLDEAARLR